MAILLKIASVRVSSIQIMQVRVQNKGKSVWKSRYDGDVSTPPSLIPIRPTTRDGAGVSMAEVEASAFKDPLGKDLPPRKGKS